MPVYDFSCKKYPDKCNGVLLSYRIDSYKDPNPECPTCGGTTERRFDLSPSNLEFKGLPTPMHSAFRRYPKK
jgi:hypothetical protein